MNSVYLCYWHVLIAKLFICTYTHGHTHTQSQSQERSNGEPQEEEPAAESRDPTPVQETEEDQDRAEIQGAGKGKKACLWGGKRSMCASWSMPWAVTGGRRTIGKDTKHLPNVGRKGESIVCSFMLSLDIRNLILFFEMDLCAWKYSPY